MPELLLPSRVQAEIAKDKWKADRERRLALAARLLDFNDPVCREWAPTLQQMDPRLRLGRARPQAYEPGMNVIPGFYHWVRDNTDTGAAMSIEPITGPNHTDEEPVFAEPDSGLLRRLQGNDLQDPRVFAALIASGEQAEVQREAELERDRERLNEEVLGRWKAEGEGTVSMSGRWAQKNAGRRGRTA